MITPTYTYRIYQYINGLDETFYRVKRKGAFGLFRWWGHRRRDSEDLFGLFQDPFIHFEWDTREEALSDMTSDANWRRREDRTKEENAKRAALTVVIIEDVEA